MPLAKLLLRPGMYREGTIYSNTGGWYDGNFVRFRSGLAEKIGGWIQYSALQFQGICRSLWSWTTLAGASLLGLGTNLKYYVEQGGYYNDITPIVYSDTLTNPFTTVSGSKLVTVTDSNYSPNIGDYIIYSGASSVGGILISGEYTVTSIVSSTQYKITAATTATSSATGGGTVSVQYEYPIGLNIANTANGWGSSPWGAGGWGLPYATGISSQLRLWTNDNYGQDLVIAPRGGSLYYWQASGYYTNGVIAALGTRAQSLQTLANYAQALTDNSTFSSGVTTITVSATNAAFIYPFMYITGTGIPAGTYITSAYSTGSTSVPISNATTSASSGSYSYSYAGSFIPNATNQVISSAIQEFIITFGSNPYQPNTPNTTFNPLLVRWSDQANPYQWVPALTNQAGEFALSNGSYIVGARATRQEILVWTDTSIYSMQYIGTPYVWGFQLLMDNISILSPNSMITINNITYWMGNGKFYTYTGTVQTLPCALKQYIFDDINMQQSFQIFAGSNEAFNEVWWYYCSANSTTINRYVVYNYLDNVWYYGQLARTAWLSSPVKVYPIAADYNSRLLLHENGNDDVSTGTAVPINAYIQSSDVEVNPSDAGQHFGFVWRMLPDVNFNGSTVNDPYVNITLVPRQNSGTLYTAADNPQVTSGNDFSAAPEYTVNQFTGQVYTRLRGRQMAFKISSNSLGVAWQLGTPRYDVRSDGRR